MPTILCVDADPDVTTPMREAFSRAGHEMVVAHSGHEALRLLQTETFALVILELTLPDMSGLHVLSALRASRSRPIPVVVFTTQSEEEIVLAAFRRGAADYVTKPCSMPVLICRVTAILRRTDWASGSSEPFRAELMDRMGIITLNENVAYQGRRAQSADGEDRARRLSAL